MIHNETLSIKEYNKSTNKDLHTSSSSDPYKPYAALSILFLMISVTISGAFVIFILTHAQKKKNNKFIVTNINENYKTSEYKKSSKLFFNDMTNISDLDVSLLNIDQIAFKSNDSIIYDIKYIKNLNSSNSLYLVFNNLDGYIEKSGENKYLIFASTDKNEMVLGDYTEIWDEIKVIKYSKDFMKIKFGSDDDLPLGKISNIPVCIIIVKGVFEEDGKYYPQVLLHDCFYEHEEDINPLVVN